MRALPCTADLYPERIPRKCLDWGRLFCFGTTHTIEAGMTTLPDIETHRRPLVSSELSVLRNSPLLYGLGSFGLVS